MEYTKRKIFFAGCSLDGVEDLLWNLILMFQVILFHTHELNIVSKHVPTPKPQALAKLQWHTVGPMWHPLSVAPWTCIYLDDYDLHLWSLHSLSRISMLYNTQLCSISTLLSAQHVSGSLCLKYYSKASWKVWGPDLLSLVGGVQKKMPLIIFKLKRLHLGTSLVVPEFKNPPCNTGEAGLIPDQGN